MFGKIVFAKATVRNKLKLNGKVSANGRDKPENKVSPFKHKRKFLRKQGVELDRIQYKMSLNAFELRIPYLRTVTFRLFSFLLTDF